VNSGLRTTQSPGSPHLLSDRRATIDYVDHSNAGVFIVVVGGALILLLVLAGRAGRGLARDLWAKMGLIRWVLIGIVVVIFIDLANGFPNK
jgi:hypothetical protein